jgi:hypothetical protein
MYLAWGDFGYRFTSMFEPPQQCAIQVANTCMAHSGQVAAAVLWLTCLSCCALRVPHAAAAAAAAAAACCQGECLQLWGDAEVALLQEAPDEQLTQQLQQQVQQRAAGLYQSSVQAYQQVGRRLAAAAVAALAWSVAVARHYHVTPWRLSRHLLECVDCTCTQTHPHIQPNTAAIPVDHSAADFLTACLLPHLTCRSCSVCAHRHRQVFQPAAENAAAGGLRPDAGVNAANALCSWAELVQAPQRAELLQQAVTLYRAALAQEEDAAVRLTAT